MSSLRRRGRVCFAPIPHQAPWVLLLGFPEERICPGTPETITELKNTSFSEFGYLFFYKYPKRPLQKPESVFLPEVTRLKCGRLL